MAPLGQAQLEPRLADLRLQLPRRALGRHQAVVDDPDAVGELVGLLEVLRRQEDRRALVVQLADLLPDRRAAGGVEAGGRLVEEEDARLVDQRRAEVEPAAHAARVGAHPPVGGVGEADAGDQRVTALLRLGLRDSVQRRLELHQLAARHQRVERGLLERDADRAPHLRRLLDHVEAGHRGATARRPQQRGQHPDRRRLAGAVRPEEGVDLARGDLEVHALHGPDAAGEGAFELSDFDRGQVVDARERSTSAL